MRFSFLIVFFFLNLNAVGQNLVPNPSFEDTMYCPLGVNSVEAVIGWQNFGNSPDVWNECASGASQIPNLSFGYQYAHSGKGMAGMALYRRPNSPNGPNYREFIGVPLLQPTISGVKYYISFFLNFSYNTNIALACNKAGVKFSTVAFDSCCHPPLTNSAHLFSDSIFTDSLNWNFISGSFVADSNYNYLMLGNFFDDLITDTLRLGLFPDNSYYYFDDVCVSTDSLYNQTWTGLNSAKAISSIYLYPNPATERISIRSSIPISEFKIINISGTIVREMQINNLDEIDISQLNSGFYSILFLTLKSIVVTHFIKI